MTMRSSRYKDELRVFFLHPTPNAFDQAWAHHVSWAILLNASRLDPLRTSAVLHGDELDIKRYDTCKETNREKRSRLNQ